MASASAGVSRAGAERAAGSGGQRGFGLGLSIVRAIARAHGGEVTAEPRADGGLAVTVSLPAHAPAVTA